MAVAVGPRPELLHDPRHLSHRRVDQSVAQCLGPGGLLLGVAHPPALMVGKPLQRRLFRRCGVLHALRGRQTEWHVGVNGDAPVTAADRGVAPDLGGDHRTPVTALSAVALIAEPLHQDVPGRRDAFDVPAGGGRLTGEAVAGQGRAHHVEILGQRFDDLGELHNRPRPAVGDDQRQRIGVRAALVDEMDIKPVDLGDELIEAVQAGLASPPVIPVGPVAGEFPDVVQRNSLRPVLDAFALRPAGPAQALP